MKNVMVVVVIVMALVFVAVLAAHVQATVPGDVFQDGVVDGKDWVVVLGVAAFGFPIPEADVDKDGIVNEADLIFVQNQFKEDIFIELMKIKDEVRFLFLVKNLPFDFDGSGAVDIADMVPVAKLANGQACPPNTIQDLNNDGFCNVGDIERFNGYFNKIYFTGTFQRTDENLSVILQQVITGPNPFFTADTTPRLKIHAIWGKIKGEVR